MKSLAPQCVMCRHLDAGRERTCRAYPVGIPDAIWKNLVDHRAPVAGDGGTRFAADPSMAPSLVEEVLACYAGVREKLRAAGVVLPEVSGAETAAAAPSSQSEAPQEA